MSSLSFKKMLFLLILLFIVPVSAMNITALGDLLLKKGIISQEELNSLDAGVSLEQLLFNKGLISQTEMNAVQLHGKKAKPQATQSETLLSKVDQQNIEENVIKQLSQEIDSKIEEQTPVQVSYGKKGLSMKSRDGDWATNIQWRAQFRYTNPYRSDPRQVTDFTRADQSTFEMRRARMKIGGHGYKPWLKYYFEVDLQPTRKSAAGSEKASTRLIDWRLTLDKYDWLSFRAGQWKINYNRERVDSSGRQSFVERSIVTRTFTLDRQVGVMAFGRLFAGQPTDMRYFLGVFNGEGRGVRNDDSNMLYMGRLQWNFLGRDLKFRQSDVGFTEEPAGTLSFAAATTTGRCTRWSSSGCGNLDGFEKVAQAADGQYKIQQYMQETAFKWHGFAWQQELHWKKIKDRVNNTESDLKGGYAQAGYFFHNIFPTVPKKLELAFRYAFVDQPNKTDIALTNARKEYTGAINYFINGHNNKLTLDYSFLTLDDTLLNRNVSDQRVRFQWDVSF